MKKSNGSVMKFIPILFSLVAITILSLFYLSFLRDMDVKDQVDLISREYILKMETKGYLTSEDECKLIEDLRELGVIDIHLNGTTRTEVGYGNPITLQIGGSIHSERFKVDTLFELTRRKERMEIQVLKTSTAKH